MKTNITRIHDVIKMNKMSDTIQLLQLQKTKKKKKKIPHVAFTCELHFHVR